jgi:hypothetical protein
MRESPAWNALPENARRVLDRLELEHMRHGGSENGSLVCRYDDFELADIRRQSIALAIRQCVALGFIKITQQGRPGISDYRSPSKYRLTYVENRLGPNKKGAFLKTDDWKRIKTDEMAKTALQQVASEKSEEHVRRAKRVRPQGHTGQARAHPRYR